MTGVVGARVQVDCKWAVPKEEMAPGSRPDRDRPPPGCARALHARLSAAAHCARPPRSDRGRPSRDDGGRARAPSPPPRRSRSRSRERAPRERSRSRDRDRRGSSQRRVYGQESIVNKVFIGGVAAYTTEEELRWGGWLVGLRAQNGGHGGGVGWLDAL